MKKIEEVCERAQYALWNRFWDNEKEVFVNHYPVKEEESWIYWWHAHALDALLDGFVRTKETYYLERFEVEYEEPSGKMEEPSCITGMMIWSG